MMTILSMSAILSFMALGVTGCLDNACISGKYANENRVGADEYDSIEDACGLKGVEKYYTCIDGFWGNETACSEKCELTGCEDNDEGIGQFCDSNKKSLCQQPDTGMYVSCAGDTCGDCRNGAETCDGYKTYKKCVDGKWDFKECSNLCSDNKCLTDSEMENMAVCEKNEFYGDGSSNSQYFETREAFCSSKTEDTLVHQCIEHRWSDGFECGCQKAGCADNAMGEGELCSADHVRTQCTFGDDVVSCNGDKCGRCKNGAVKCKNYNTIQQCKFGEWDGMTCDVICGGTGKKQCLEEHDSEDLIQCSDTGISGEMKTAMDAMVKEGLMHSCPSNCKYCENKTFY